MITNQAYIFIIFVIVGFVIGLLFDFFRILRRSIETKDFITYIEDILFCLITGSIILYSIFYFNMFIVILIVALFYLITISNYVIKINVYILTKIIFICKKVVNFICMPLKFIFKNVMKMFKPIKFIIINIRKKVSKKGKKNKKIQKIPKIKRIFNKKVE